jgi:hypothetical protein
MRMLLNKDCNIGKFINCEEGTSQKTNCYASSSPNYPFLLILKATRMLHVGEELICRYKLNV